MYYLPEGYAANPARPEDEATAASLYWTRSRLRHARDYQAGVYDLAQALLPDGSDVCLIDVGCGPGVKLSRIAQKRPAARIVGIDRSSTATYCREKHRFGEWVAADLNDPTSAGELRGDVVVCADVIEHLEHPERLLQFLRQVTKPQGCIVISTPERKLMHGPECRTSPNPEHVREWTKSEFQAFVQSQGFVVRSSAVQLPMRARPSALFVDYLLARLRKGRPLRTSQVHVLHPN